MLVDERLPPLATRRDNSFFADDIVANDADLCRHIAGKSILVVGGAGTIGSSLVEAVLAYEPRKIHVVDINENTLATLTRKIRGRRLSPKGTELEFNTLDIGSWSMRLHLEEAGPFDSVFNFAAVKHVRSEKNLPCILHMLSTNVVKQYDFLTALCATHDRCSYFVVSTDKAADPSNFMGASKRLLEFLSFGAASEMPGFKISSARFANVAFSNGSLLESFVDRLAARIPLAAPRATRRYFISPREAAEICLLGELKCPSGTIAIPTLDPESNLVDLIQMAEWYLVSRGFEPVIVETTEEAFALLDSPSAGNRYPIVSTPRDTAGEKEFEVFCGHGEQTQEIGLGSILALSASIPSAKETHRVVEELRGIINGRRPGIKFEELRDIMTASLPNFQHIAGHARLDDRL